MMFVEGMALGSMNVLENCFVFFVMLLSLYSGSSKNMLFTDFIQIY